MRPQELKLFPQIPSALAALSELTCNLHWTWDRGTQHLFESLDPRTWHSSGGDPMQLIAGITTERWNALADDPAIVAATNHCAQRLQRAMTEPRWFQTRTDSPLESVAYFSPEFGISETLPQYAGGLGILAGDHLKAASDLGIPLTAIGLMYDEGYFRQSLNADGMQEERYPPLDPHSLPLHPTGVQVEVDLAGDPVRANVWRVQVGRVPLFLLDTNVVGNGDDAAAITDRLYGGDSEHRLRQEILLGIGGVRALRALGLQPQVFHTNEGHAGFLSLERMRELIARGMKFSEAKQAVRAGGLFTTHTPVQAGIDRFTLELMDKYFRNFAQECGCSFEELVEIGQHEVVIPDEAGYPKVLRETPFNMAVMGLRLAGHANGVAQLHGKVSREMFAGLWPNLPVDDVPICAITNGVHASTWVGDHIAPLLTQSVGRGWSEADATRWASIDKLNDHDVWDARARGRAQLVAFVRSRIGNLALNPNALTIGFARRFATYKRATLLLAQPERLRALLLQSEHEVQFVFAGKAHPADQAGKDMIREIELFARQLEVSHRFVFVPDYDMAVARAMYHGCDVWLNNPRRPLEACGTSGMKAALNGALNCSILDGWWDECYDGKNGWAIETVEDDDLVRRDHHEADSLFGLFENEIVPLFYARDSSGLPHDWVTKMKDNWRSLGPFVNAARMVRDYTTDLYEHAAAHTLVTPPAS